MAPTRRMGPFYHNRSAALDQTGRRWLRAVGGDGPSASRRPPGLVVLP